MSLLDYTPLKFHMRPSVPWLMDTCQKVTELFPSPVETTHNQCTNRSKWNHFLFLN